MANEMRGGFNHLIKRPYINQYGVRCVTMNTGDFTVEKGQRRPIARQIPIQELWNRYGIMDPVFNSVSMRKEDWEKVDTAVVRAARPRMTAWNDLAARNSVGGFNAMAKLTYEYEAMSDPGEAIVDMDGITDGRTDSPLFKLLSVPLPITHSDFWYSQRRIDISGNSNTPLDTTSAEAAGRRVGEMIEKTLIGVETGITAGTQLNYPVAHTGTSTVFGYINYPYRIVKTNLTAPDGTNPQAVLADVLSCIETMQTNNHYGPYMIYHSTGYTQYLNNDYFRAGSTSAVRSLRDRLMDLDGIVGIKRLDYLGVGQNFQMVIVQLDNETVQAINGMEITTLQWPSQGGMRQNFKVMCIKVPLLKSQYNGVAAIMHASTASLS
jgi:hypothetical protein